jgi:anti-sigma factor RsiW
MVAYAHGQLDAAACLRVERHVRGCGACRTALSQEQWLAGELRREMPRLGQPAPGQMRALWPAIRAQMALPGRGGPHMTAARRLNLNPASGLALVGALMCVFLFSTMMYAPASAVGAPLPPVPADIQATPTPFTTAAPGGDMTVRLPASRTATLEPSLPIVPPAPEAFVRTLDAPENAGR